MNNKEHLRALLSILGDDLSPNSSSQTKKYKVNAIKNNEVKEYNYYLRDSILTKPEQEFYNVLLKVTNLDKFSILSQVSLIEIFQPTRDNYWGSKGKIQQLHLDFLVCRKRDLHPVIAIELDDRSHSKDKRKARDIFIDELFC